MTRHSQFLSAAVCAVTLLLMAGHALAQDTANAGLALAARARRTPATPLQMALRLEKEQAMGAGVLMPIPERQVRLSGGVIPLDGKTEGFPAEFFKGLVPDEINGVEAWRATLRTDDASGDMLFYNADGEVFWSVAADAKVWSADWIARLHSTDCKAADFFSTDQVLKTLSERQTRVKLSEEALYRSAWLSTRQYLLPSHVVMTFTFILREDIDAYRAAGTAARSPDATVLTMPMSMSAPLTGLAVTGFATDTNGVALSAAWPTGTSIAGDALDIFFTRTLIPPAWSNLWRVAVEPAAGAIDVAIPRAELPPPPDVPPAACVTNIVPSAYDPGVMVTNIVCTNGVWLTDSGFFRLADLADTDGDGLTDACENWMYGTRSDLIDTDGDTLDDGWEAGHSLNPLSADGVDGASGDPDADGLPNIAEFRVGTDPHVGDWDGDTLLDGDEAAWWEATATFPWLDVTGGTVVLQNSSLDDDLLFAALPFPVHVGGAVCTNAALDVNGIVYLLNCLESADDISSRYSNKDMGEGWKLTENHFAVAAHWDDLLAQTASPATKITVADVTTNGTRYCVIEYRDMGFYSNSSARISFQVVIPENGTNTVCVRYADVAGANTGGAATLGAQGPGAAINIPVSFNRPFITNGLTLAYHFGAGGSPFVKDTDGDGLSDAEEAALGTDPRKRDTDGDRLPDGWEADHGFNPAVNNDTDGIEGNGAEDDFDDDGLSNFDEYLNGSYPDDDDSDDDETNDGDEVVQGSDPNDPSDNGQPPPPEDILELPFHITGDYAAWEMTVEGLGPGDTRVFKLSTDSPGDEETVTKKLIKGNSYRLTMSWLGSGDHTDPYWYCWEAQIDGLPAAQAYGNPESVHTAVRATGVADTVAGDGWFAQNADGLLTSHVHSSDNGSGNVAGGLEATLHVPKIVTETVATSPPDRSRKTIGVGEEVALRVLPEGLTVSLWAITQGDGDLSYYSGPTTTYTAPGEGDDVTVTATIEGADCPVDFHVIEPTGILMENRELGPGTSMATETWMNIAYLAYMYLQPASVSFYRVRIYEGASPVTATGYFTLYNHGMSQHQANGPHFMEDMVVPGKGTRCTVPDNVAGLVEIIDSTIPGDMYWIMDWTWDVVDGGAVKSLETIQQNNHVETVNGELRFTITKDNSGYWISPSSNGPQAITP